MPLIPYESSDFGPSMGPLFIGFNNLSCTWNEIIWAAITVGREKWSHVIQFGKYSWFEMLYRTSIIFANLKQSPGDNIVRSQAYDNLDPSEKSAISYFLGLMSAKLFAAKLLDVYWLMHIEKYRDQYPMRFWKEKSRPDLFGPNKRGEWVVIEAKGRSNRFDYKTLQKAKVQTRQLRTIAGQFPAIKVALESHFNKSIFQVSWKDPNGLTEDSFDLDVHLTDFFHDYYLPFLVLLNGNNFNIDTISINDQNYHITSIHEADLIIGINKNLSYLIPKYFLIREQAEQLMQAIFSLPEPLYEEKIFVGGDGVLVSLGQTWDKEKMMLEPEERSRGW